MENKQPVIVGIGELLWDVLPTGKRAGGAPVNFVYHATQLGAEGYAISAVGNDLAGTEILQELDKNGIGHSIATVDYPTGTVLVELNKGIPTYNIVEGVAWDHIPLTEEAGTAQSGIQKNPEHTAFLCAQISHALLRHQYPPEVLFRRTDQRPAATGQCV